MVFHPVATPFFPIAGMLVFQTLLVFSLTRDRAHCSRPYIGILGNLEALLFCLVMSSAMKNQDMILAWNMGLMACRLALPPLLLWMALELNGASPLGMPARRFVTLLYFPLAAVFLVLVTNSLHGLYWPRVWFESGVMVVERSLLCRIAMGYSQAILLGGGVLYIAGIPRHFGPEKIRLILFCVSFVIMYVGEVRWRLDEPNRLGVNPLGFLVTTGGFVAGVSVALFGFPRAKPPVDRELLAPDPPAPAAPLPAGRPPGKASPGGRTVAEILGEVPGLSEQQRKIVEMVVRGQTYRAAAGRLGITERTVKYHMARILDKCGLETRDQLIAWVAARRAR